MSAECAFCLADLAPDNDTPWCGAPCKASWSLLFEDPEDVVPDDDVYAELDGELALPLG